MHSMPVTRIPYSVSYPDPQDRLDKSMSLKVGDFAPKKSSPPNYHGRTLGVTLDGAIMKTQLCSIVENGQNYPKSLFLNAFIKVEISFLQTLNIHYTFIADKVERFSFCRQ